MRAFHTTVYIIYCNRDKLKVISYIWPLSQHIIQEVSCATYRCGHQSILTSALGILSKSPNDDKKCRKEKICWKKKHAIATIKLPNQMPVCECTIVEEKSEMRTKNRTTMQKNNQFKIYEMKKKTRQIIVQCLPLQLLLVLWQ